MGAPVKEAGPGTVDAVRQRLFIKCCVVVVSIMTVICALLIWRSAHTGLNPATVITCVFTLLGMVVLLLRNRINRSVIAHILVVFFLAGGYAAIWSIGIFFNVLAFVVALLFSVVFLEKKFTALYSILSVAGISAGAVLYVSGARSYTFDLRTFAESPSSWIVIIIYSVMLVAIVFLVVGNLLEGLGRSLTEIRERNENLRRSQEMGMLGDWKLDLASMRFTASETALAMMGFAPGEAPSFEEMAALIMEEDRPAARDAMQRAVATGEPYAVEIRIRKKGSGELRHVLSQAEVERGPAGNAAGLFGINMDITERKTAAERLRAALAEKELLLRELYHRTKNNMQVICAMIELRADQPLRGTLREAFEELVMKIRTMALVHQRLYESSDLASIDLGGYLKDIASLFAGGPGASSGGVSISIDAGDVPMSIDIAIPFGLVINELLTNSFKHAFPSAKGSISIVARGDGEGLCVEYRDNGVGYASGAPPAGGLGTQILRQIVEKQLHGRITMEGEGGFFCSITVSMRAPRPGVTP